jgi:hypothetical protein
LRFPKVPAVYASRGSGLRALAAAEKSMEAAVVIYVLVHVVFGIICAAVASHKGRSAAGWFFLGIFFEVIALIIILCLSNLKEEAAWRQRDVERSHRLREQLRQEQVKNAAFQRHAVKRLDLHDGALRMDTREAGALAAAGEPAQIEAAGPPPIPGADLWHYAAGREQRGPIAREALADLLRTGNLARDTLVWTEGMAGWQPAGEAPELNA